jgi:hypothetical protein
MFRLQFNYTHVGDLTHGFTENFYVNTETLDTANQRADMLAKLLVPLHGAQTILTDCRVLDLSLAGGGGSPRRYQNVPSIASSASTDSDYPTTAIEVEMANTDGTATRQWLKGLPDDQIKKGKMSLNGEFPGAFKAFSDAITKTSSLICMRVQDPTANFFSITNITEAGIVTAAGHGFNNNDFVIITGRGIGKYWRKTWEVLKVDNNTFKLLGAETQPGYVFSGKGKATFEVKIPKIIHTVTPVRATSHKVRKAKN